MALDGLVIANLRKELADKYTGARINKIAQPEPDELLLTFKTQTGQSRLLISANASLPLIYITGENKQAPLTAPAFCMLLRKHIAGGRILSIEQPGFERILIFTIEHLNDMGDLCEKRLIVELMGKHSNIIFTDDKDMILDSIKHIPAQISSVREVLPGRPYFIPAQEGKTSPLHADREGFFRQVLSRPLPAAKALYGSYTGISPLVANEICFRAGIDGDASLSSLSPLAQERYCKEFLALCDQIRAERFEPNIVYADDKPVEFSSVRLTAYRDCTAEYKESISEVLHDFYAKKSAYTRIHQKSSDLRHIVNTLLERAHKKYALQQNQLKDTNKKEKYRKYGELIHIYGYSLPENSSGFEAEDYETGKTIKVPLDKTKTPMENAKKYYDRYAKLKRTEEALAVQIKDTQDELTHLESIAAALDIAENEQDLAQIREELSATGYIKKHTNKKKSGQAKSKPYHYRSSDGYDIYIGKNNFQNDYLTFKLASGNDWWFHAKGIPGSHVIVKTKDGNLPDRAFEEAAALAAWYSKGRESNKVEIDYVQKKEVKKPNGSKPGFVVYYTNYSMSIAPKIDGLERLADG